MPWFRDRQSPRGARLRMLLVLGLVMAVVLAVVAENPLWANTAAPTWLHLGTAGPTTGSLPPSPGAPDEAESAAAAKRKGDKQDRGKDQSDQKAEKSDKRKGGKSKHRGEDKDRHPRGGNGKHPRDGKRDTPQRHKHQGGTQGTGQGKGKDKKSPERRRAADLTAADVSAAATSLSFAPVADAQVNEASPTTNYGRLAHFLVDGGADPDVASYLRFDVSGVSAPVQKATLRLFVRDNGATQNGPFVQTTGTSWSETGLTWSNRPGPSGAVLDDKGALAASTWVEYSVTSAVKGNGAVGFVLLPQTTDGAVFHSREGANKPQLVLTLGSGTATLLAAGDIASCSSSGDEATAKLLDGLAGTVATLGDNAYESGTSSEYTNCYKPTWGRHKSRTQPAVGNHEYLTSGASGYFGYFTPEVQSSYYSYDLGSWHIVVLDSNCSKVGGCGGGSPQETWLRQDLAAHPAKCTLAYWHHPRFSFGNYSNNTATQALWQALYDNGAEIVLAGHDHNYQRWTPQTPSGAKDTTRGIRQFVVGTGGKSHYGLGTPPANVEKSNSDTYGVLQLTLRATSYDWQFVPVAGKTFTDTGSTACH